MTHVAVVFHGFIDSGLKPYFQLAADTLSGEENAKYTRDQISKPTILVNCNVDSFNMGSCGDHMIDGQRWLEIAFESAGQNVTTIADRKVLQTRWSHLDQTEFGQIHVFKNK